MIHLPTLIQDLGIILICAGVVTVLFKKIGQPVVLGYIISGLLISSHVKFLPTVKDLPNIQIWADIGVIFLLFALGLEFSFKKLIKVGPSASITAIIEVIGMVVLGYLCGYFFGWNAINSLFLGGILAISSTTIIIRTFNETGMKGRNFTEFVFGILIIEDLVAVLLLVLLSTVAITNGFNGEELIMSALKLVFFVVLCFVLGIFILPTILKFIRSDISEETLLIVSLAFCFLMVTVSTLAGFSPALGAFIMGSIIAETVEVKKIEHLIRPLRDLFGAVFFVSVGMLINPKLLWENSTIIIVLTLVTVLGKFFTIMIGARLSRKSIRHSVQSALCLAQIGEFSFIIASLGHNLKVTNEILYPLAVGVSVITTFITPYLIAHVDKIYGWMERYIFRKSIPDDHTIEETPKKTKPKSYMATAFTTIFLNASIIYAIFSFLDWLFKTKNAVLFWAALVVTAPFFWAILMKDRRKPVLVIEFSRIVIIWLLINYWVNETISLTTASSIVLLAGAAALFLLTPYLRIIYHFFETHFLKNFMDKEIADYEASHSYLAPWDAHITNIVVPPESTVVGKSLVDLKIRETFGISIALIERGEIKITAPGRNEKLFPNDRIAMIGEDKKLKEFIDFIETKHTIEDQEAGKNYSLFKVIVTEKMSIAYKTILKSGIREKTHGMVAGVERHGEKILNPDSRLLLLPGDMLWIVGDADKTQELV